MSTEAKHTPTPWRVGRPLFRCKLQHRHGTKDCRYTFDYWYDDSSISQDVAYSENDTSDAHASLVAGTWDCEEGGICKPEDAAYIVKAVNAHEGLVEALTRLRDYLKDDGLECYCDEMGQCGLCEADAALEATTKVAPTE